MCANIDQASSGSTRAKACGSFWKAAGASLAGMQANAAIVWGAVAMNKAVSALTDRRGLPQPSFASAIVRITEEMGCGTDAIEAALLQASTETVDATVQADIISSVDGNGFLYRVPMLQVEIDEVRTAWSRLLSQGACTILSDAEGNLRPGAQRSLARLLGMVRQREILLVLPTAEDLLRELSTATIRRHMPRA